MDQPLFLSPAESFQLPSTHQFQESLELIWQSFAASSGLKTESCGSIKIYKYFIWFERLDSKASLLRILKIFPVEPTFQHLTVSETKDLVASLLPRRASDEDALAALGVFLTEQNEKRKNLPLQSEILPLRLQQLLQQLLELLYLQH